MQPRNLIVISGEELSGLRCAKQLLRHFPSEQVLQHTPLIHQVLGKEYLGIIYNSYQGFDPDFLAAAGGTLVAGGVLLLVTPPLDQWPGYADPFTERITKWSCPAKQMTGRFIKRFVTQLQGAGFVQFLKAENSTVVSLPIPDLLHRAEDFKTRDQQTVLLRLLAHVRYKKAAPVVVEADRGRGKSALLGMLVARLVPLFSGRIGVTAPRRKTAEVIFRHAGTRAPLDFWAADQLLRELPPLDLLLVDEAAALPAPVLAGLLDHYPNSVFSTTVHGYEGTGRGFALRFKQRLCQQYPGWQLMTLSQPVRYAENDRLENVLFDSLLLNALPVDSHYLDTVKLSECQFETLDRARLARDEALLREVFGLLVLAHYQTRPTDLRLLLDGVDISVSVMRWQGIVVATALSVREGGFDSALSRAIYYGLRRPRGHLAPQTLAVHAGIDIAPRLQTERIMRIVVHPALQRQGIARRLLRNMKQQCEQDSTVDYLSSSFAATAGLLAFWHKQGYSPVRLGFNRDASSGNPSVMVIQPLTAAGKVLFKRAQYQFQRLLPFLQAESLVDSGIPTLFSEWVGYTREVSGKVEVEALLNAQDYLDIHSFAWGRRGYESCLPALKKVTESVQKQPQQWCQIHSRQQLLLENKIIGQCAWSSVIERMGYSGKRQAIQKLREAIQEIVAIL